MTSPVGPDLSRLQRRLGHAFADQGILEAAITHRSAGAANNERLEFLGDATLGYVIAHRLFDASNASEHRLTLMRAHIVNRHALAEVAREIGLGAFLRLGLAERRSGARDRASILADSLEAVIGAVVCDGGTAAAARVVERLFRARLNRAEDADLTDSKTRLQELLQARGLALPVYAVVSTAGADHAPAFEVECAISPLSVAARGQGKSRREAEKDAARNALAVLAGDREGAE